MKSDLDFLLKELDKISEINSSDWKDSLSSPKA